MKAIASFALSTLLMADVVSGKNHNHGPRPTNPVTPRPTHGPKPTRVPNPPPAPVHLEHRDVITETHESPMQTFMIPLPEEELFNDIFKKINSQMAYPPITTEISIAVSTDDTVIWYDHWEDGYEDDISRVHSKSSEIWGDHDASNGCAPNVNPCTDAKDVLHAGDVIDVDRNRPSGFDPPVR